jgi:integrase
MARKKVERKPPTGSRTTSAGRITITIPVTIGGRERRLSQNKILPSEPRSYATVDEAWEGYNRVQAYLKQEVDRELTVAGFRDRWLDEDDVRWGMVAKPKRGRDARYTYASATRGFAKMFGERPMASITETDILAYQRSAHYAPSQMVVISTLLRDAERDKLRIGNPAREIAREAGDSLRTLRERDKPVAPSLAQVNAALDHMRAHLDVYPRSLYGWLLTGARTGLRGGELDGMEFAYVKGDRYDVQRQLHYRTNMLDIPKHRSFRKVYLPPEVLEEIEHQRAQGMAGRFIWTNTQFEPWRHDARDQWWSKVVGGTSLRQICGDVPIYNATRHHWASWAVNIAGFSPYQASVLMGHKDGGKIMIERYVTKDLDAAVDAAAQIYAQQPIDLAAERARRRAA